MSVLACGRGNCPNIMCNRLILEGSRYICDECWDELVAYKESWPDTMTAKMVRQTIEGFMDSDPGEHKTLRNAWINKEFERLTTG